MTAARADGAGPLLEVEGLGVRYATAAGPLTALDDVSFSLSRGRAIGIVGESGSGKSTVLLTLLGLLGPEAEVRAKAIRLAGANWLDASPAARQRIRGDRIGAVFQDPGSALNPALRVGFQVAEPLLEHRGMTKSEALGRAEALLAEVGIARPADVIRAYPHQLSGGMKQRALIATALACEPELLLLDEPTTALDVTIEAQILDLLEGLRAKRGLSMLFVSHNLGVVDRLCDEIVVLYAGRVAESGATAEVFRRPRHPYTRGLLGSLPRADAGRVSRLAPIGGSLPDLTQAPAGCIFQPRCPFAEPRCEAPQELARHDHGAVRCWKSERIIDAPWPLAEAASATRPEIGRALLEGDGLVKDFRLGGLFANLRRRRGPGFPFEWRPIAIRAVDGVSLTVRQGEVLGLVGESGCGKSTLGRLLLDLVEPTAGTVQFEGKQTRGAERASFRRRAQIVFQNPDSSLNPRKTVEQILRRPIEMFGIARGAAADARVDELLDLVRLSPAYAARYPHQLSGGEKQRVGIARALASEPSFIVCDEAVSALDVSVQAAVLNLLADLRDRLGVAYLFISHDISVIAHVADRIAVMYRGAIVEDGPVAEVLSPPYHPYTEALLSAVPLVGARGRATTRVRLRGDVPTTDAAIVGCRFHFRCPRKLGSICETVTPPVVEAAPGHRLACHIPIDQLAQVPPVLGTAS